MKMGTAALLAGLLAAPVAGHCETDDRIAGPELVQILQDAGYKAKLDTDSDGDPLVRTSMDGLDVTIFTYDCEKRRCGSLQLSVGIDLPHGTTAAVVNKFNTDYRYARAFLDDENDPYLRFDFEVRNTRHAEFITSQLDSWEKVLGAFTDAIGFRDDDPQPTAPAGHVLGLARDVAR